MSRTFFSLRHVLFRRLDRPPCCGFPDTLTAEPFFVQRVFRVSAGLDSASRSGYFRLMFAPSLIRRAARPALAPRLLFFSGGTALRDTAREIAAVTRNTVHLVTPFDSGGSSATLRQSFDMPAVGDARSRIIALADTGLPGNREIITLCAYRLPEGEPPRKLAAELNHLVCGTHPLLSQIPDPALNLIREHLAAFAGRMPAGFPLAGASIGNLVLAAGYLRGGRRLGPALSLLSRLVRARGIVRPVLEDSMHLCARLSSGEVLVGQHHFSGLRLGWSEAKQAGDQGCGGTPNCGRARAEDSGSPERRNNVTDTQEHDGKHCGTNRGCDRDEATGDGGGKDPRLRACIEDIWLSAGPDDPVPATPMISARIAGLIRNAEAICYPVGSFYSSVLANLLPAGVGRAVAACPGPKLFTPNLGEDPELTGHTVADQITRLLGVLMADAPGTVPADVLTEVIVDRENGQYPGGIPEELLAGLGIRLRHAPLVRPDKGPLARPDLLASAILRAAGSEDGQSGT